MILFFIFHFNIAPVSEMIRANAAVGHWAISDQLGISERTDVRPAVAGSGKVPDWVDEERKLRHAAVYVAAAAVAGNSSDCSFPADCAATRLGFGLNFHGRIHKLNPWTYRWAKLALQC